MSLEDMQTYLRSHAPLGSTRASVRAVLVDEGQARRFQHPERKGVEKYVYDINLCRIYIWRWNISANYDDAARLTQVYVNGEPVHSRGDPLLEVEMGKDGRMKSILEVSMPRPEADRGESSLAFFVLDTDAGTREIGDEFIIGAGPSRADPSNLGTLHAYSNVERWRSIFSEEAPPIVPYSGTCP